MSKFKYGRYESRTFDWKGDMLDFMNNPENNVTRDSIVSVMFDPQLGHYILIYWYNETLYIPPEAIAE